MGNCFCIPGKPLINNDTPDLGLKPIKPKDQMISTPTSNHSKNPSPKHDFKNGANNENANKKKIMENNNEEDDDMESVTQIFIRNEDENIDSENINDQAKIKIEDFKLLKV